MIQVNYTATIQTVSGTPFGYDSSIRLEPVTGSFTYDTSTPDAAPLDPRRGNYPHTAGGGFTANFRTTTVTGSATPYVQIENLQFFGFKIDTFRFIDGPRIVGPAGGIMSVDGTPDASVELAIAMTDSVGNAFANDSLPTTFPFAQPPLSNPSPNFSHTFSLRDRGGILLLQFDSLAQASTSPVPEPASALLFITGATMLAMRRRRAAA